MNEKERQDDISQNKADSIKKTDIKAAGTLANKKNQKILILVVVGAIVAVILGADVFAALHFRNGRFVKRGPLNGRGGYYGMMGGYGHMGMIRGGYGFRGGNYGGNGAVSANRISGKVTAVNGQTFTIDASGTTKDVQITSDTRFPINSSTGVKTGDQVLVIGQQDSSGKIQATQIIVNPQNQTGSNTETD